MNNPTHTFSAKKNAFLVTWTANLSVSCNPPLEEDAWCREAAPAIAGRTEPCTANAQLANSRYEASFDRYTCVNILPESLTDDSAAAVPPQNLVHLSLAIRHLPCELVDTDGDELDQYIIASPTCDQLVEEAQ